MKFGVLWIRKQVNLGYLTPVDMELIENKGRETNPGVLAQGP